MFRKPGFRAVGDQDAAKVNQGIADRCWRNTRLSEPSEFCQIELAGGKISDSTLTVVSGDPSRFFRLDGLIFENVKWLLKPDNKGVVGGLMLGAIGNDTCIASFDKNRFRVAGTFSTGQLINSVYSAASPGNSVTATFHQCEYQVEFVTSNNPATKVAVVQERGTWRFSTADFGNRDPLLAIRKGP